ncbi:MAG: hemolysin III family protein [Bacteroidales bacterium]|nr:hemolysin III family protein [Bacteroidales bacterium]
MDKDNSAINRYSHSEEIANSISHILGAIMALVVCTLFLVKVIPSGSLLAVVSMSIYFFGVLSSYIASSLYHACPIRKENSKFLLRKFDHAAIYWHIAGSYTPITLIAMYNHGETIWAVGVFVFIWICAILGTVLTFRKMKPHSYLKTACYVLMGLLILVAIKPLYESVGLKVVMFIVAEGLSYIIGAVFYSFKKTKYMHSVFHVFVILGDVFHMIAVWNVIGMYL